MYTKPLSKRADSRNLEEGKKYTIRESIPLMPAFDVGDLMLKQKKGMMPRMFTIPVRGVLEVMEIKLKRSVPWYKMQLIGEDAKLATGGEKKKVEGWVNSVALVRCGVFEIEEEE